MKLKLGFWSLSLLSGVAVGSVLWQVGCDSSSDKPTTVADAGSEGGNNSGDIVIGMTSSLTNGFAGFGVPLRNAVLVAEQQINQVGVLDGRHIKFKILDDASDKQVVVNVVNELLADKVPAILGPLSSGQALNVQDLTFKAKVVQISAGATSPLLSTAQPAKDRYFFRTTPADNFQGKAIAKFIYDGVQRTGGGGTVGGQCRKAYLINSDDAYGAALIEVVQSSFTAKQGATIVGPPDKVVTALAADYKQLAGKIVAAQPDCLVMVVYSDVAAAFLRDLKAAIAADTSGHDWSKFFATGSDSQNDTALIPAGQSNPSDPTSANSTENLYGTTPDPAPDTVHYQTFRNIWQQSYPGKEPDPFTANSYDSAILVALAIQQAGTATDGTKIRDALYTITSPGQVFGPGEFLGAVNAIKNGIKIQYPGASGSTNFDDHGDVTGDYALWHVVKKQDGTFGIETVGKLLSSTF